MLGILVASLVVLICLLVKKKLEYFSSRGIPYSNMSFQEFLKCLSMGGLSSRPQEVYEKERESGEPCVGYFHSMLTPSLLALDPGLVESVLIKDFSHFHDHGLEIDTSYDVLAGHLFNLKGDQWRTLRHKLLPTFTSGKLRGMVPTMDSCAKILMDDIKKDARLREEVNLKESFFNYTLSVIASCVFDIDPTSVKDPNCMFREVLNDVLETGKSRILKITLIMSLPKIAKFFKIKTFSQMTEDFFIKLTKDALALRKRSGVKKNDFVQLLLELKERGTVEVDVRDLEEDEKKNLQQTKESETNNTIQITDELLSAQAFVFIVGGFDGTSYLAAMTMYLLGKHKDIQKRVREEVREALSKHGGMNYMALKDMKLLSASMNEALRINSAVPILLRQCNKTYTLSKGVTVEKGMSIMIPTQALQMDNKYWQNPEKFDPDRFLTSQVIPGTYLPFGDGPRVCIAQRLVLLIVKVILARLVVNFELQPSSKTKEPFKNLAPHTSDIEGGIWGSFEPLNE